MVDGSPLVLDRAQDPKPLLRLVWFERHQFDQDAIAREKELKGWRRSKKVARIESLNPGWVDRSRGGMAVDLRIT